MTTAIRSTVWALYLLVLTLAVCAFTGWRVRNAEYFMIRMAVDAAQGFPAWREHVARHPEELFLGENGD
jgi:hypothetical protein